MKLAPAFSSHFLLRDICAQQSQGKLQDEDISLFANPTPLVFTVGEEGGGESREKKGTLMPSSHQISGEGSGRHDPLNRPDAWLLCDPWAEIYLEWWLSFVYIVYWGELSGRDDTQYKGSAVEIDLFEEYLWSWHGWSTEKEE